MTQASLTYQQTREELKKLRDGGAVLLVKLNAKHEQLTRELSRLTVEFGKKDTDWENYIRPAHAAVGTSESLKKHFTHVHRSGVETMSAAERAEVLGDVYARQRELSNREVASESASSTRAQTYYNAPVQAATQVKPVSEWDVRNRAARHSTFDRRERDAARTQKNTSKKSETCAPKVSVKYNKSDSSEYFSTYTSKKRAAA